MGVVPLQEGLVLVRNRTKRLLQETKSHQSPELHRIMLQF